MKLLKTENCQVCGYKLPLPKLNLGNHPLCDDLIPISKDKECEEYPKCQADKEYLEDQE